VSKGDVHTLPHNGDWANKIEGSRRVANTAAKKAEAQAKGRQMALRRKVEHLIHNKGGAIGQRNSYGRDPRKRKGELRVAATNRGECKPETPEPRCASRKRRRPRKSGGPSALDFDASCSGLSVRGGAS
jgi:Uncharacterized protein conserved in bacteria (DUF2188)